MQPAVHKQLALPDTLTCLWLKQPDPVTEGMNRLKLMAQW
jgi:hypothetical protein